MKDRVDGAILKEMVLFGAAYIDREKQSINDLNVFPVPDGDTGTNMSLTIASAAAELRKATPRTVAETAKITAGALLRGARGNSGVILSLLFRGISRSLKGQEYMDGVILANALQEGVTAAYSAVMKPAEGTVLTVSRLAARRAVAAAAENSAAEYVLEAAIREGELALADTVNQNPVLKKAGVVDAGGKGFLIILNGMLACLRGEPMPETDHAPVQEKADFEMLDAGEITFAFDTVYIVRKKSEDIDLTPLRIYLDSIGDSLVIGEDDEAFKVHVHTNIPGEALTESQKYGTLELAKIENMRTQYEDLAAGRKAQSTDDLEEIERELEQGCENHCRPGAAEGNVTAPIEKKYGFISVCAGDGIADVFRDVGCDRIISGGQTMNPSTESILNAVNATPAEVVFVLPNNKNIIMAAEQCRELSEKQVVVIPTKSIPQGMAAMLAVDTQMETEALSDAMKAAIENVTTAQITYAARDSDIDGFAIKAGEYLALMENSLFGSERKIEELLHRLADVAKERDAEFITLFYGSDVSEQDAQAARDIFASVCPDAEVSVINGGQPVYYYVISIE